MSTSSNSHQRPQIWSYVSFSRPRRRSSVALPRREVRSDPYEKPDRFTSSGKSQSMYEKSRVAWMNQGQRSRWIKTGALVAFVLFVLYHLAPSSYGNRRVFGGSSGETTTQCSKPYSSDKPLIQYALMIDAGSTGSRIHVYRFNNCGPTPELENEEFKMTPKMEGGSGLSRYAEDPEEAARSLDMLMDVAVRTVPESLKSCSPIAVKATAGLRKVGQEKAEAVLKAVRRRLETVYPFPVVSHERGGVEVMDGKDEGVYAWITTNYLLGKIGGPDESPTAAVFDLGGGSTQIVFQPTFKGQSDGGMPEKMEEGDHKYELTFGGRRFELYQHSYLGYGLMAARENLHRLVVEDAITANAGSTTWLDEPLFNPCLGVGMSRLIEVPLEAGHTLGASVNVTMTGPTSYTSTTQCRALAEKTLKKDADCALTPCAFNGVHQPSLAKTFAREDIYLFSYFYDRTNPLGMPDSFTLDELKDLTARVCEGGDAWKPFSNIPGAMKELEERPEHCLDLNFMLALLHTGYEMPMEREVRIAKKLKGNELGWCLGASLPLLETNSGWTCRIKEVA